LHDKFLTLVKVLDEYEIPIHGLKEGIHNYEYEIGSGFFEHFENPDLPGGDIVLDLTLKKGPQFIELDFHISGTLRLICDRCLELFDYELEVTEKMFLRFGDRFEELDDNVIVIPREESRINIAQYIYEFAALSIPYKKVHPEADKNNPGCDPVMLKKLNELKVEKSNLKIDTIDPRWDKLKNLN